MKNIYWIIIAVLVLILSVAGIIIAWQMTSEKHQAKVNLLEDTIQNKERELQRVNQEIEELSSEKVSLNRTKLEFNKKLADLEAKVQEAKEKEESFSAQVEALTDEKRQLEKDMTETIESMQNEMQSRAQKIKTEADYKGKQFFDQEKELLIKIKNLQVELDDAAKEKSALEKELIDLFAGLIEAKTKIEHYNIGFIYEIEGDYQAAIKEYEEILKLDLREPYANMRLASIYINGIEDPDRATYYAKAYQHSRNPIKTGRQIDSDLVEAAQQEVKSTIKLNVAKQTLGYINMQKLKFHYNYALLYDNMGMYKEAICEYEKALEYNPDDPDTHYNLGIVYDNHIKDKEKAIYHYNKYLEFCDDPGDIKKVENWIASARKELQWRKQLR